MAKCGFGAERREEQGRGSEDGNGIAKENTGHGKRIEFDSEVVCREDEAGKASDEESGAQQWGKSRSASGEQDGEDDAESDAIELDKGVTPDFCFPGVVGCEIPAGETGYGEHGSSGDEQSALGEFAHGGGPEEIELLLEGDKPEGKDDR